MERTDQIWRRLYELQREIQASQFVIGLLKQEHDAPASGDAQEMDSPRWSSPLDEIRCVTLAIIRYGLY